MHVIDQSAQFLQFRIRVSQSADRLLVARLVRKPLLSSIAHLMPLTIYLSPCDLEEANGRRALLAPKRLTGAIDGNTLRIYKGRYPFGWHCPVTRPPHPVPEECQHTEQVCFAVEQRPSRRTRAEGSVRANDETSFIWVEGFDLADSKAQTSRT